MSEEDSYLYVNEGGFTPGMYRPARKAQPPMPTPVKWSPWHLIPGVEIGGKRREDASHSKDRRQ